jgi:hypothetical protein
MSADMAGSTRAGQMTSVLWYSTDVSTHLAAYDMMGGIFRGSRE